MVVNCAFQALQSFNSCLRFNHLISQFVQYCSILISLKQGAFAFTVRLQLVLTGHWIMNILNTLERRYGYLDMVRCLVQLGKQLVDCYLHAKKASAKATSLNNDIGDGNDSKVTTATTSTDRM